MRDGSDVTGVDVEKERRERRTLGYTCGHGTHGGSCVEQLDLDRPVE